VCSLKNVKFLSSSIHAFSLLNLIRNQIVYCCEFIECKSSWDLKNSSSLASYHYDGQSFVNMKRHSHSYQYGDSTRHVVANRKAQKTRKFLYVEICNANLSQAGRSLEMRTGKLKQTTKNNTCQSQNCVFSWKCKLCTCAVSEKSIE